MDLKNRIENTLIKELGINSFIVVGGNDALSLGKRRCIRCGTTPDFPGISFDSEGFCSLCTLYEVYRKEIMSYFLEKEELASLLLAQPKDCPYHCLLLYSGGKDSTFVLYSLVRMGLRVMTFTFDNGFISAAAFRNIENVTRELGIEHKNVTAPAMNEIFAHSLQTSSTVCKGCFASLLGLSTQLAHEKGIRFIVNGLSRGQIIDERLRWLFEERIFDRSEIERRLAQGRLVHHTLEHKVNRLLGVEKVMEDPRALQSVQIVDFFRYCAVTKSEIIAFLRDNSAIWKEPKDTGFCSTNCMINDVGIEVHWQRKGFHNYEGPTRWEVRLGHLTIEQADAELRPNGDAVRSEKILSYVGYEAPAGSDRPLLDIAVYFQSEEYAEEEVRRALVTGPLAGTRTRLRVASVEEFPVNSEGEINLSLLPLAPCELVTN